MEFTDDDLRRFQDAYAIDFGDAISEGKARDMLTRLVLLYEHLAQPLPQEPGVRYETL